MSRLQRGLAAATVGAFGASLLLAAPTAAVAADAFGVRINEVVSNGGSPDDWIEFYNESDAPVDLSGYIVQDESDKNPFTIPAGTIVQPGEYYVIDTLSKSGEGDFDFGLGKGDSVRLFAPGDANGATPVLQTTWPADTHAVPSWGMREDGTWAMTAESTKGAANIFASEGEGGDGEGGEGGTPGTTPGSVVLNEVDSQPADWVELYNPGTEPFDISGYELRDNADDTDHRWAFPVGTVIAGGELLLVEQGDIGLTEGVETGFGVFGIGSADEIRLFNASGELIDRTGAWTSHAAIDGDFAVASYARCIDGVGTFELAFATPGTPNNCVPTMVTINEVESSGGVPGDWIELYNPTSSALDIGGIVVKDNDDSHAYTVPTGTTIPAAGYLVLEEADFGFGLGGGDSVRLFDGDRLVDSTTWPAGHANPTWGRCPDGSGPFTATAESTKGAPNICAGDIELSTWPGSPDVRVLDETSTFLEDSSGLDTQETDDGTFLWLVDNGTGTIWKFKASADGSVTPAEGWADGKRVRYQRDAENAGDAGPDSEGITVDGAGNVYVVAERDNSAKGVNQNTILKVNPNEDAADLVAVAEWDITELLPQVGANLGAEAVEWVSNDSLAGKLWDDNTDAPYVPGDYSGDGLFLVAVEDGGGVFAFALGADGAATLVSTIDPGLPGVMGLDYDTALGVLWAMCDDGCSGRTAQVTLNGSAAPAVTHFAPPAGLPNINNEGFATAPASLSVNGQRPVWWFADGFTSQALRVGTLPGGQSGGDDGSGEGGSGEGGSGDGGSDDHGTGDSGAGTVTPLPGASLTDANRGGAVGSTESVHPGDRITITVGSQHAGTQVEVWMYSTPSLIGSGTLNAAGAITVTVPWDTAAGDHRIAVYALDGTLLGWTDVRVDALAVTGAEAPSGTLALGALGALLLLGGAAVMAARRQAGRVQA